MKYLDMNGLASDRFVLSLPGLFTFIVYALTLAPTLQVADAGEQITAAHFLGVSHPTGTPLYLLLMKGWETIFPFGTVAWRMNLLNAVLGSVGAVLFSRLIFRFSVSTGTSRNRSFLFALSLSTALGYSQTYWYESTAASSYVLHYVFVIAWLLLISRVVSGEDDLELNKVYFVTGLALANHILSLVLLVLTLWYSASLALRRKIPFKTLARLQLFLLPGLLIYLYVPLRAASKPILNWGNPDSVGRLFHYLSRGDYYSDIYDSNLQDFGEVFYFHFKAFLWELTPLLPLILVALALWLILGRVFDREKRHGGGPLSGSAPPPLKPGDRQGSATPLIMVGIAAFLLNLFLLSLHGSHLDLFFLKRYMVMGYIGLFFSSAVLVVAGLRFLGTKTSRLLAALVVLMPVICLAAHFERNDRSRNTLLRSYVEQLLSHLPEGAAFHAVGDNHFFPVLYYHLVEGLRPDLTLFNPDMGMGDKNMMPRLLWEGNFYSSHYIKTDGPITFKPAGLVFRATRGDAPGEEVAWRDFREEEIRQARAPLEKILLAEYYYRRSVYHEGRDEQARRRYWIRKMETVAGGYDQTLMMTGRAYARVGMVPEAIRYFEEALRVNPKNRVARFLLERQRANEGCRPEGSR